MKRILISILIALYAPGLVAAPTQLNLRSTIATRKRKIGISLLTPTRKTNAEIWAAVLAHSAEKNANTSAD